MTHRYWLRVWLGHGPTLTVILKNPSLADQQRADPTVGKVEAWARRHGFGAVSYLNLFAFRSPHPADLNAIPYFDAVGPENDAAICALMAEASLLVAAWGNPNGIAPDRYTRRICEVLPLLTSNPRRPLHLVGERTRLGHPRHGLHWNGNAVLMAWL